MQINSVVSLVVLMLIATPLCVQSIKAAIDGRAILLLADVVRHHCRALCIKAILSLSFTILRVSICHCHGLDHKKAQLQIADCLCESFLVTPY